MTLINVPKSKLDSSWKAKDYTLIEGTDPYTIASDLALSEWSYADSTVIAVIDETFEKPNILTEGEVSGSIPAYAIDRKHFDMKRPTVGIGGNYQPFTIGDEKYKYIVVEATWDDAGFEVDLQLYDNQLGLVSANMEQSYQKGAREIGGSYIHNYETWEIGLTAFPKKSLTPDGKMKSMFQTTPDMKTGLFSKFKKDIVNVDVMLYPGIDVGIDTLPPFGCRDATFRLTWDNPSVRLGFAVLDPSGAEIASSLSIHEIVSGEIEEGTHDVEITVEMLGECHENEHYSVCVFSLDDLPRPVDFTLDYGWYQKYSKTEGDGLASATNGAVLASSLNTPLLYASPSSLTDGTKDVLYKLGVENIYLVNLGDNLQEKVKTELQDIATIRAEYTDIRDLYQAIQETAMGDDVIFTTIEPWNYWYVTELTPSEDAEKPGALYLGPAAYIAAQHGSPVIIVDIHPELSQAVAYHKDFWVKNAAGRNEPSLGDMVITGRQVYKFLDDYGFDKEVSDDAESLETIITVAGQFNIGPTWDRTFVGKATPGRFQFSPVDTAYWISRNVFYPALIYVNPAMQGEMELIQGSSSKIQKIGGRLKDPKGVNLVITKHSGEETFEYPVLQSYCSIAYKFNEQASKHWGTLYTRADGITPYITPSPDPIDVGAVPSKPNVAYYPDLDDSNVVPFYANKAGYGNVFSTNFDAVVENLNRGVIMFVQDSHGYHLDGGMVSFWDSENPYIYEENPWRAYEPILFKPGHLRTFLHWLPYLLSYGEPGTLKTLSAFRPIKFQLFSERGSTENPDVAVLNPDLAKINKIFTKLNGGMLDLLGAFGARVHWDRLFSNPDKLPIITTYDGMVTISPRSGSLVALTEVNGYEFDDAIDNLHSVGINTVVCLPAGTYLQMTWIRHGSVYTIMDPWSTSDYCAVWLQSIIKNLALGDTIGQAYEKGIGACGSELLTNSWWWDVWENVCFYGDPNLRVFVPGTEYSDDNYWEQEDTTPLRYDAELAVDGHMPFGATNYPHAKEPVSFWHQYMLWIIVAIILIAMVVVAVISLQKKKK